MGTALADTATASAATASASASTAEVPLPELPKLAPIEHPPPTAEAIKELEARLSQLLVEKPDGPLDTDFEMGFLTEDLQVGVTAAMAQQIQELRDRLDGRQAEKLLEQARKAARQAKRKAKRNGETIVDDDWLRFVLALAKTDDETWNDLVRVYGMLRMLEAIGTTSAVRHMIDCYSYFGELVRIDLQRAVERLKDRAVPALIEARKHDARRVRRWAARQLDGLGRAIPGEAVSSTDPEVLADVLRAFGRTRDVDAARVVLSFCNSEQIKLREAARESIAAIGEPAKWQLREAYDSLTGTKPPRSWSWERTAQEIFRLHDHARLAVVYRQMDEGAKALADGRHAEAVAAFDKVLARSPLFPRRGEMMPAYVGHADLLARDDKREEAMAALRKALRLAPPDYDSSKVRSQLATLEAEELIEEGTPDRFLLERAIDLDPNNDKAKQLLASLEDRSVQRQHRSQRYLAAVIVGLLATVAMVLLARRRRRPASPPAQAQRRQEPAREPEASGPPSDERPTREVVVDAAADEMLAARQDPVPDSDALPTRELDVPPCSDALPTRELDEPPASDAIDTPRIEAPEAPISDERDEER
jgi:tetratricopeptide (TPR) repeat protein